VPYFTWKDQGLTEDCASLASMAARFEEAANLMRRMASEGFHLERSCGSQLIAHADPERFQAYGFVNEEPPARQLGLVLEPADQPPA
jgi:hypothetical protein